MNGGRGAIFGGGGMTRWEVEPKVRQSSGQSRLVLRAVGWIVINVGNFVSCGFGGRGVAGQA